MSSVWEKSYNNVDTFYGTLQTLESQSNSESDLSFNKALSLFALLHTAQIIPPNAAIVIFTNSLMNMDTHLENAVLNSVLTKNITVSTKNILNLKRLNNVNFFRFTLQVMIKKPKIYFGIFESILEVK